MCQEGGEKKTTRLAALLPLQELALQRAMMPDWKLLRSPKAQPQQRQGSSFQLRWPEHAGG